MVTKETEPGGRCALRNFTPMTKTCSWGPRDFAAAIILFAVTAGVILWQNAHIAVLWDLSYVLDTAARIAAGQMPYRDFPLVHSPLTFVVQAAIMRLTGRVLFHHTLYVAAIGGLSTLLTWRIALRITRSWPIALVLAAPLAVLGIYCILPHPSYDCESAFWMLVALWFLLRLEDAPAGWGRGIAAGVVACMPAFFKQNMGLPFLVAVLVAVGYVFVWQRAPLRRALWGVLAGAACTLAVALVLLHFTAGLGNYLQWTVQFAGQRRMPTAGAMFSVYAEPLLWWMLPCLVVGWWLLVRANNIVHSHRSVGNSKFLAASALLLMAAPFVWTLSSLLRFEDKDDRAAALLAIWPLLLIAAWALAVARVLRLRGTAQVRDLLPWIVLAAITGTFMSQQLWGSTYAIWPLLVLLVAELMSVLPDWKPERNAMAAVIAVTLLVCGAAYLVSEERLEYAQFPPGAAVKSTTPQLKGLATPGPFVPELDELLRYVAENIPPNDGLVLIPGEDPFYFATGRVPRFPVLLFDPTTDPYSPEQTAAEMQARGIRWLIVKRNLQMVGNPAPEPVALMQALQRDYAVVARLRGYDVYKTIAEGPGN